MQIIWWTARRVWISWAGLPWNTWSCTKTRLRNRSCPVHDHRRRDGTTRQRPRSTANVSPKRSSFAAKKLLAGANSLSVTAGHSNFHSSSFFVNSCLVCSCLFHPLDDHWGGRKSEIGLSCVACGTSRGVEWQCLLTCWWENGKLLVNCASLMPSAFNFKRVKKYQLRTIAWSAWMILPLPRVAEKLRCCVVGHSTSWYFCFPVERLEIVWPRRKDLAQKVHISTWLWNQNKSDVSITCDGEVILHQAYLCHAYRRLPRMHPDHRVATKPCGSQPKKAKSITCMHIRQLQQKGVIIRIVRRNWRDP